MKFILDWSQNFYEEKIDWRGDEKVMSLEISQRECCFAVAKVFVFSNSSDSSKLLFSKKYAKIGVQLDENIPKVDLLFSGRVVSFPVSFGKSCVQLELIAEPTDFQKQLSEFSQKNIEQYQKTNMHEIQKEFINFDDLFFSQNDLNNPTIFLEGGTNHFYWDMRNGKLSLSDINRGNKTIEISDDQILDNSINISLAREPYKSVNINLSVNWTQHLFGLLDLYPLIASKFKDGIVSSLTNIKNKIKKLCDTFHSDSYKLLRCNIKEVNPSAVISMKTFPMTSNEITINENGDPQKKISAKFKRFYLHGEMLLNWSRKQKREETLVVNVVNGNIVHGREKNIHLKLNPIQLPKQYPNWSFFAEYILGDRILFDGFIWECKKNHFSENKFEEINWKKIDKIPDALADDSSASFFRTIRGRNAIKYALQNAVALINYSSRYVEISFIVDAANFLFINISDQITLIGKRFDGGKIVGKITKTKLIANSDIKLMQISIACTLGNDVCNSTEKINEYLESFWSNGSVDKDADEPTISLENIVKNIEIKNPPEEQIQILSTTSAKTLPELISQLKANSTNIKISLAPLNSAYTVSKIQKLPDFILK